SCPAKTVMDWSGTTEFCMATRTAGRILPAAQPQMEFTTTIVVPAWASAASTSSAVRVSWMPARVSSSRIGMTMTSGYMIVSLPLFWILVRFRHSGRDQFCSGCWFGNRQAFFTHKVEMAVDRFLNVALGFLFGVPGGDAAGQIGHISAVARAGFLENDGEVHLSPACFLMLFDVPAATSSPGCPG